ncbi:MAG: response regulator, partial [Coriobacteriia bacterium]|nr:response regulator [Coriobacteriia bacterium]
MPDSILIVDDEKEIADLIELYLQNEGFQILKHYNGASALHCVENESIDLAILDVMLPDIDGFALCAKIR